MKIAMEKKIFCLEGLWEEDLTKKSTILPILELLYLNNKIEYIYRDCATKEEFEFYLQKWPLENISTFRSCYWPFMATKASSISAKHQYPIDRVSEILGGKCENAILFFASCKTLQIDKRKLKKVLKNIKALAICGYRNDVDWMKSAAFELLVLNEMQLNTLTVQGVDAIRRRIVQEYRKWSRSSNLPW